MESFSVNQTKPKELVQIHESLIVRDIHSMNSSVKVWLRCVSLLAHSSWMNERANTALNDSLFGSLESRGNHADLQRSAYFIKEPLKRDGAWRALCDNHLYISIYIHISRSILLSLF